MVTALSIAGLLTFVTIHILRLNALFKNVKKVKGDEFRVLIAWILMYVGLGLYFQRQGLVVNIASIDASATFQFTCVTLALIALLFVNKSNSLKYITSKPILLLFIYSIIAASTVIVSPAPIITFYKAFLLIVDMYLVCVTLNVFKNNHSHYPLEVCYFITALFAAGALLGVVLNPDASLTPSKGALGVILKGLYPVMNPNELGFIGALCAVIGLRRSFSNIKINERIYWTGIFFMGFVVMFLAQARTSLITALLAIVFMSLVIKNMRWISALSIAILLMSIVYAIISGGATGWQKTTMQSTAEYIQRGQSDEGLQTMKGRVDAWMTIGMKMFVDSPLIGHGYDAGVRYDVKYGMAGSHMHNSHIQIIANTGILGYLAWIGFVLSVVVLIFKSFFKRHYPVKNSADKYYVEICAVLMLILLRTMTGQVMVTHQWSLLIFLAIYVYAHKNEFASNDIAGPDTNSDKSNRNQHRILRRKTTANNIQKLG